MRRPRLHGWLCGGLLLTGGLLALATGCAAADAPAGGLGPGPVAGSGRSTGCAAGIGVGLATASDPVFARAGSADAASFEIGDGDARADVCVAVRDYLATRDRALVPGGTFTELTGMLCPGSPAEAQEPAVARGRAVLAARSGLCCADVSTGVDVTPGAVAFYAGAVPVAPADVPGKCAEDTPGLRATVVATVVGRFTWSDLSTTAVREDHVLVLAWTGEHWSVFDDRYAEARLAGWLEAGGAGAQRVREARRWAARAERTRRLATTPEAAVRSFVTLLDRRRYPEADLLLAPAFGGTAEGMGMWLDNVRVVGLRQVERSSSGQSRLLVTLDVEARPSPWNEGKNLRWFTLVRNGESGPWRISAIDSGP